MKKITVPIEIEAAHLSALRELYPGADLNLIIETVIERGLVKSGTPPLKRHGIGKPELIRCADIALAAGVPVEGVIAERKALVARAVSEGFRTGEK